MRTLASGFVSQSSSSANSNALLSLMQEQMANCSEEEILEMIRQIRAGKAEGNNTYEIAQTEHLPGEGEVKFSNGKGELIISKPVFGPKAENAKELVYYSLVKFYGHYSLREFMTAYLQTLYSIDENEAGVLLLKIEAYQQSRGLILESIWESGFESLKHESTKEQKYRTIHFYLSEETYAKFAQLLNKEETKRTDKQNYPAAYKGIMETDVSALPDKEKKITQQLQYLISQISPEEWAVTKKNDASLNNLEDLLIKQLTTYLQGRQAITGNLKQALAKQDAQATAEYLKVANQQILVSLPVDLRLGLIKLFAQKQVDEAEVPLTALINWCPPGQTEEVVTAFAQNNAQLFKDLQKLIANKKTLAAAFQQLAFANANLPELVDLLMQNLGNKTVDSKKVFPWNPGRAFTGIKYDVGISNEGKVSGSYKSFVSSTTVSSQGAFTTYTYTDSKQPEDSGVINLDPLEIVVVKLTVDDAELGKKAGDCVLVPAILLLQMENTAEWNSLMVTLKVALNVALFATGVGQVATARSAWAIIEGTLLAFSAVVETFKSEIAKTETGKEFLKYYEVFAFMQGMYYGVKLLVEVPELIAGMARYWNILKTINKEPRMIAEMAKLDAEMGSLKTELEKYVNTLNESEKAKVLRRIAMEELKVGAKMIALDSSLFKNPANLAKLIRNGIQQQLLRADASIEEIRIYFKSLGLAGEMTKLGGKELNELLIKARTELEVFDSLFKSNHDYYIQILKILNDSEKQLIKKWIVLTRQDETAQTLLFEYLIGGFRNKGIFVKFNIESNNVLREQILKFLEKNSQSVISLIAAETMLMGAQDIKVLETIVTDSEKIEFLFRGTSEGFAGKGNMLAETTSTSADPLISTLFAMLAENRSQGKGILLVARIEKISDAKIGFSNTLVHQEIEVALNISPLTFSKQPLYKKIDVIKARSILIDLGYKLPSVNSVKTIDDLQYYIENINKMSTKDIKKFIEKL